MNLKGYVTVGVAVAALAASGGALAQAQDTGFYLGAAVGYADYDIDDSSIRAAGATAFSVDNSATGWKAFGGYQFHRNWGAELGYVDLGSIGFRGAVGAVPFSGDIDVTAWTLALVGTLPLNQNFDLIGKLGAYNWKSKGRAVVGGVPVVGDDDGTDAFGGLGVRYNFSRNVGVQVEWEHYSGSDKVNLFSIGLRFKF